MLGFVLAIQDDDCKRASINGIRRVELCLRDLFISGGVASDPLLGHLFLAKAGNNKDQKKHKFIQGQDVIMFVRPETIFMKTEANELENSFIGQLKTVEFEGNLKNIYLSMKSKMNVRFSVPNVVDTSDLSTEKDVELTFSSQNAVVLPRSAVAVD